MSLRSGLAIAALLSTSGCINYSVATGDESARTLGLLAVAEISVPAVAALLVPPDDKEKQLPYPLRALIAVAVTVMVDGSIMMAWRAE